MRVEYQREGIGAALLHLALFHLWTRMRVSSMPVPSRLLLTGSFQRTGYLEGQTQSWFASHLPGLQGDGLQAAGP